MALTAVLTRDAQGSHLAVLDDGIQVDGTNSRRQQPLAALLEDCGYAALTTCADPTTIGSIVTVPVRRSLWSAVA